MSEKFDLVMNYYQSGLWDLRRVRNAVEKGWITPDEYQTITGASYVI